MSSNENLSFGVNSNKKEAFLLMESFYTQYSPSKAQEIISDWYTLEVRGQFKELSSKELESYTYFFSHLDKLILSAILLEKSI